MKAGTTRSFSMDDQQWFARFSGDCNPIHTDALAARRLLFGSVVVHGLHALLWALDALLQHDDRHPGSIDSIKAVFHHPIRLDQEVRLEEKSISDRLLVAHLYVDNRTVASIKVGLGESPVHDPGVPSTAAHRQVPNVLNLQQVACAQGRLPLFLDPDELKRCFPQLEAKLPIVPLAELVALTRLVGMECPGLHSIFSELALECQPQPAGEAGLRYAVTGIDRRFSLVNLEVAGPTLSGKVRAFFRPGPVQQSDLDALANHVRIRQFESQRALVIGGSRGLGEMAVKLLSAGGAEVTFTYCRGEQDAGNLARCIREQGWPIDFFQLDVTNPESSIVNHYQGVPPPTHLYYFATPHIFDGQKGRFSKPLFDVFSQHYVHGFWRTFSALEAMGARPAYIFYPGTIASDDPPPEMMEYVAAKAAGEAICRILHLHYGVAVDCPHLPRMATDQTVSIYPAPNSDPLPTLLQHLSQAPSRQV